jgi:hypothetical protein
MRERFTESVGELTEEKGRAMEVDAGDLVAPGPAIECGAGRPHEVLKELLGRRSRFGLFAQDAMAGRSVAAQERLHEVLEYALESRTSRVA